ncbi:MAG: hypothetical protein Q9170_007111 [Blastenia crenularia]
MLLAFPWRLYTIKVHPLEVPQLILGSLGRIAFTGSFEALSLHQYAEQIDSLATNNGSFGIFQQLPNGDFMSLGTADGYINQVGNFAMKDGSIAGIVLIGNFTSISGIECEGVAILDSESGEVTPLPGLLGTVNTLLLDGDHFYVGGDFKAANSTNALMWEVDGGWANLPWDGFNGPVNSIEELSDGSLAFGGSFDSLVNQTYPANFSGSDRSDVGDLSGLFGFNVNAWLSGNGSVNGARPMAISRTRLDPGATIYDLVSHGDSLFVAGLFGTRGIKNIMMIQDNASLPLQGGGLNDAVTQLHLEQDMLYVGGNFTGMVNATNISTDALSNVAVYYILQQRWQSLGAGVNGPVTRLNPLKVNITPNEPPETVILVNGFFDELRGFGDNPSVQLGSNSGLGVWVPSQRNWLQNLPIDQQAFYGYLSDCTFNATALQVTDLICVGTLSSYGLRANMAAGFAFDESNGMDLNTFNFKSKDGFGTTTGMFYGRNGLNLTIVGGQFAAIASDQSMMRNLAFVNTTDNYHDPDISGITTDFGSNATIQSLAITPDNILYAGGVLHGSVLGQEVDGIFAYDLQRRDFLSSQPSSLLGASVEVKAMQMKSSGDRLYIGGSFERAGSIECPGVCAYDMSSQKWTRPGSELGGSVTYLAWTDRETLVAAGELTIDGIPYALATLYAPDGRWAPFREDQAVPGQITAMSPADPTVSGTTTHGWSSDATGFWIAGIYPNNTAYLTKWDGTSWSTLGMIFGTPSRITGIQSVRIDGKTDPNDLLGNQILILTGSMAMDDKSNASAVLFNGTTVWPLISTVDADGNPGTLTHIFSEQVVTFRPTPDPKGFVVAIAVAVLAALISIIVIGEVGETCRRLRLRRKSYRIYHN